MLGKKRTRSSPENSGTLHNKKLKTSDYTPALNDKESTAANTQSKCITPISVIKDALPDVTVINTFEATTK